MWRGRKGRKVDIYLCYNRHHSMVQIQRGHSFYFRWVYVISYRLSLPLPSPWAPKLSLHPIPAEQCSWQWRIEEHTSSASRHISPSVAVTPVDLHRHSERQSNPATRHRVSFFISHKLNFTCLVFQRHSLLESAHSIWTQQLYETYYKQSIKHISL